MLVDWSELKHHLLILYAWHLVSITTNVMRNEIMWWYIDCAWMAIFTIVWKNSIKSFLVSTQFYFWFFLKIKKNFTETEIIKMLELLIDKIFVMFWWICFLTDRRHRYVYLLSSSSSQTCTFIHIKHTSCEGFQKLIPWQT